MKKFFGFIQEWWGVVTILVTGITTVFTILITAIWVTYVQPKYDNYHTELTMKLAKDSLEPMVYNIMSSRKGGFRTQISEKTGISKESIADSVSYILINNRNIYKLVDSSITKVNYLMGVTKFLISQSTSEAEYNGVKLYLTGTGDAYYMDENDMLWHAFYVTQDDKYYYFPPYANGKRIQCK